VKKASGERPGRGNLQARREGEMAGERPSNDEVAQVLDRIAELLEAQDANPFRVRAYRKAADSVRGTDRPVAGMVKEGDDEALQELPGVGKGIASTIGEFVNTGRSGLLQRLQGTERRIRQRWSPNTAGRWAASGWCEGGRRSAGPTIDRKRDMRILMISNSYHPVVGGVEVSMSIFRRGLIEAGHEVHIVVPECQDYEDREPYVFRIPGVDVPGEWDGSLGVPLKGFVVPIARGIHPHVVHSQTPFWMGDLAATTAEELERPLVFTFHTRYDEYAKDMVPVAPGLASTVAKGLVDRYLERCAQVVAPTPRIKDFILEQFDADVPVTVVPTPVDMKAYEQVRPQRARADLGLGEAEFLLYLGRLVPEKNLPFLLRAFTRVAAERPQAHLVFMGKGPEEEYLREQVGELDLGRRVVFKGLVPHERVPDYTAAADLFVFSSLTDTQGLVLIEAMAAGTPVVAIEAPGPVDVLSEGGGLLLPAEEDAFAEAICALLEDDDRRRRLGEEARKAARRYSIPRATEQLVNVYEAAVDAAGG